MEKRVLGINWRLCVALIACTFSAIAVKAQSLINGGFETAGTNYVFPDQGDGQYGLITNTFAARLDLPNGAYVAPLR